MPPSRQSVATAERAIRMAGIEKRQIGALVHGSVCRDFLEPATACGVHQRLGLPEQCAVYDVSNACLGLLNGAVQVANMIELGQIAAGVVVGTENGRALVENTVAQLNADTTLSRNAIKPAFASLTIGAASAAIVLTHRELSRTGNRLLGGVVRANTAQCHLCQGHDEAAAAGAQPMMATDSEALLREGVQTAQAAFGEFLAELGWTAADIHKTFCHQVGRAHQRLLLETLGLDPRNDFTTFEFLGNTGAAALPATLALGIEQGRLLPGENAALLGIGSGINVVMLGVAWRGQSTADRSS
jgi:3-oxoacyl-[acyl-carrier-protein] synthase-3